MKTTLLQRFVLALLPTVVIASFAASTIWGQNGLVTRYRLKQELSSQTAKLAAIERENQRMLRQLKLMEEDPVVLERMVAEELAWGRPDATIYRFDEDLSEVAD